TSAVNDVLSLAGERFAPRASWSAQRTAGVDTASDLRNWRRRMARESEGEKRKRGKRKEESGRRKAEGEKRKWERGGWTGFCAVRFAGEGLKNMTRWRKRSAIQGR